MSDKLPIPSWYACMYAMVNQVCVYMCGWVGGFISQALAPRLLLL